MSSTKDVAAQRFTLLRHGSSGNEYPETVTLSGANPAGWRYVVSARTGEAYGKVRVADGICAFLQTTALTSRHPNLRAALDALSTRLDGAR